MISFGFDARTALYMTLPPLMWAANAVVGRLMVDSMPPLTLNALRWSLAAVILLPFGWRVLRRPRELLRRWRYLLPIGLLGVGAYNALQYQALVTTTPLNVTLIAATTPVWMLAVGALFFGVGVTPRQWGGAAFSLSGALLVIARGDVMRLADFRLVSGDIYIMIAVVAWSFYSWMLARPPASMRDAQRPTVIDAGGAERGWSWQEFLLVQTLFGLLGASTLAWGEQSIGAASIRWNATTLAALAFVALGPSIVAYRCWGMGVARGGPALAAFFANLTPVFAALMSAAVLGESPQAFHLAAFALIVAGIVVSARTG